MSKMVAVLELGTNTYKYVVGSDEGIVLDGALPLRLGSDLHTTGGISDQVATQAIEQIKRTLAEVRPFEPQEIICVGAMTLRMANNAEAFRGRVREETGLRMGVLSSEQEACLAFKAASAESVMAGAKAVLDVGGGSAELAFGSDEPGYNCSLPLGAVLLTDRFIDSDPPSESSLEAMRSYIRGLLEQNIQGMESSALIVIGGTARNLASISGKITLNKEELLGLFDFLKAKPLSERKKIQGLDPGRADIIIAGGLLIMEVMEVLHLDSFSACEKGVRHAILAEAIRGEWQS